MVERMLSRVGIYVLSFLLVVLANWLFGLQIERVHAALLIFTTYLMIANAFDYVLEGYQAEKATLSKS